MSDVGYSGVANLAPTTLGYSRDVQGSNYQQLRGVGDSGITMSPDYVPSALTLLNRLTTSPAGISNANGFMQTPGNLLTYSQDFTNAAWFKNQVSIAGPATIAGLPFSKLVEDSGAAKQPCIRVTSTVALGGNTLAYVCAVGEREFARIVVIDAATITNFVNLYVNLTTGVITAGGTGGTPPVYSATSVNIGGAWVVAIAYTATATTLQSWFGPEISVGNQGYTGDGASGIYAYRAGLFSGTLTAQQILAMGGIPLTTAAAVAPVYTNADVYLAGANGAVLNSLSSGNYTLSDGSTGFSAVDGSAGLVLDAMGSVGSALTTLGTYTSYNATLTNGGVIPFTATATVATNYGGRVLTSLTVDQWYAVTVSWAGNASGRTIKVDDLGNTNLGNSVSGTNTVIYKATATTHYVYAVGTAAIGESFQVTACTAVPITGNHATQSTAGNRPTERRGALNLALQSNAFDNVAWGKSGSPTVGANSVARTLNATTFVQSSAFSIPVGTPFTQQIKAKANTVGNRIGLRVSGVYPDRVDAIFDLASGTVVSSAANGGAFTGASASISGPDSDGFYRCVLRGTAGGTAATAMLFGPTASSTVNGWEAGDAILSNCFAKEAQIETGSIASDYTPTTSAAASNAAAGRYWWQFDGTDSLATGGALGATNEFASVIGLNPGAMTTNVLYDEGANGFRTYLNTNGSVDFNKNGVSAFAVAPAATIVTGTPAVLSCRLSSGFGTIRKNGASTVSTASGVSCAGTGAITIGAGSGGAAFQYNGSISIVIAIKGTLTDAEMLTLERFAASLTPNAPSF